MFNVYLQEFGLLCQIVAGTTLGALKNNGILPWELDGDFHMQSENFTAYGEKVLPAAQKLGYKTVSMYDLNNIGLVLLPQVNK